MGHGGMGRSWRGRVGGANWTGVGVVPVVAPNISHCHGYRVRKNIL